MENRLNTIAPELSAMLERASEKELRAAARAVSRFAVDHTKLENPVVTDALNALETDSQVESLSEDLESVVEQLDEAQWNLQDQFEEGQTDRENYLAAFRRARAANAVLLAQDSNALVAATESAYEANAATDDPDGIRNAILSAIDAAKA